MGRSVPRGWNCQHQGILDHRKQLHWLIPTAAGLGPLQVNQGQGCVRQGRHQGRVQNSKEVVILNVQLSKERGPLPAGCQHHCSMRDQVIQ